MAEKDTWAQMKAGFKKKAKAARKDLAKHTKKGKKGSGSIDSKMGSLLKGNGKI